MRFKEFLKLSEAGGLWAGRPLPVTGRKKPSDGWPNAANLTMSGSPESAAQAPLKQMKKK